MTNRVVAAITALGLLAAASLSACAQETPPFRVGLVDLDAVSVQFKQKLLEEEKLTLWHNGQQDRLRQLAGLRFLSAEAWGEAIAIIEKDAADVTKAEQDRLQALEKLSTDFEREYKDLEAKAGRTDDETERFNELLGKARARNGDLNAAAEAVDNELGRRQHELGIELMAPVEAAIKTIAEEKGLSIVIDSKLVYLGGEDITELIIQQLNGTEDAGAAAVPDATTPEEAPGDAPAEGEPTPE